LPQLTAYLGCRVTHHPQADFDRDAILDPFILQIIEHFRVLSAVNSENILLGNRGAS
jgi:hypothetical protein